MAYRLQIDELVLDGIRRVAREQCDRALQEIHSDEIDRQRTVHQVRKRCKKIRGLLRLTRPAFEETYERENAAYRDAARKLSTVRDAEAIIGTFEHLMDVFGEVVDCDRLESIRSELECRRNHVTTHEFDLDARLNEFEATIQQARERVDDWELTDEGWQAISGGLAKTYRRGRKRMNEAFENPTTDAIHEWRKRAKYHWYHVRLLRDIWPDHLSQRRQAAKELSDMLGDEHDLAVLRSILLESPTAFGDELAVQTAVALIDRLRSELREAARPLGMKLYAELPDDLTHRFGVYWKAARLEDRRNGALVMPAGQADND